MMKYIALVLLLVLMPFKPGNKTNSIYQFQVAALDGGKIDFSKYKGKKILVVNTASECGYTYQYEGLEALYEKYKDKLVVVAFPANNFGGQEPGSAEQIQAFCHGGKYNVSFPMAAKVSVKDTDVAPVFQWLTQKEKNGVLDANINWNFNKFLLDENGQLLQHFQSKVEPMSEAIVHYLK